MNVVRKEAQKIAEALLYAADVTAPPILFTPILQWVKDNLGFAVDIRRSHAFLSDNGLSGKLVRKANHIWILINNNDPLVRQRFTLAHELGHLMEDLQVAHMSQAIPMGYDKERFADVFDSELLMPKDLVKKEWTKLYTTYPPMVAQYKLATVFNVSNEAMGYRLSELGLQSMQWSETKIPPVYK